MKKILIVLFIFLLFIPIVFYSSEVEAKTIADLRKELSAIEKKEAENTNNIIMTESKINATKKEISSIYDNITNITSEIQQSEKDIVDLGIKIEEKDKSTKALMSSLQKTTGNSFYVEYLFGADTIEDFIYRYAITEEYNSELIVEMNNNINELNVKKQELAAQQVELGKKQNLLSTQLQQLANTKTKLYELDRSIEDEIKNSRSVIQMYKDAGCGENEDINVCAKRLLPPDTKFWRPFTTGYVTSNFGYRNANNDYD